MLNFGVIVPQGWKLDLLEIKDPIAKWARMTEAAQTAEACGFDSVWLYDHFHTVPRVEIETTFECWTSLAALARDTKTVRLGQLVTCNAYRPPALLAKMAATVDVASGGRMEFGIGAGWYENEFNAYGYEFGTAGQRLKRLEEAIQIIRKMWTEGRATFEGKYYSVHEAISEPKPVQKPHPPITIGGGGEKVTLRLAALYADKSNITFSPPSVMAHKFEVLKRHCQEVGRPYDQIRKTVHLEAVVSSGQIETDQLIERYRRPDVSAESYRQQAVVGTPEQCRAKIQEYIDVGAEEFIFYMPQAAQIGPIERLGREVLPAFR